MAEGVAIEELGGPLEQPDETAQDAENGVADGARDSALLASLAPHNRTDMSQKLDDRDNQASETDRTKAVCEGPLGGTTRRVLGEVVRAKIPRPVHASNGCVHGVLDPFRDPVHREGHKHYQTNDPGVAAASTTARGIVARGLPLGINSHQGDGVPCAEPRRNQATNEADHVHMAVLLADVDSSLQHQGREGNPRDPSVETKGNEHAKDEEHDTRAPVVSPHVEDASANGPADVEDSRDPDEQLGEEAREPDVAKAEDEGDD